MKRKPKKMNQEKESLCSLCNRAFCKKDCLPKDPVEQIAEFVKIRRGRGGM